MEFKAELKDGVVDVKAIAVQDGPNVTIHVPSFQIINKLVREYKEKNGIRDIQQI